MVNILYPRIISIRRQNTQPSVGQVGFGGDSVVNETVIVSGLIASIQYERVGQRNDARLPSDGRSSTWMIIIPVGAATSLNVPGLTTENDVVVDDLGKRYQIYAADWQVLGYTLHASLLIV